MIVCVCMRPHPWYGGACVCLHVCVCMTVISELLRVSCVYLNPYVYLIVCTYVCIYLRFVFARVQCVHATMSVFVSVCL